MSDTLPRPPHHLPARPLGLLALAALLLATAALPAQKEPDPAADLERLQALATKKDLPDRPYVLFDLGRAQRELGVRESARDRAAADRRFEAAAGSFADAARAFAERVKAAPAGAAEPPPELEWLACSRCSQADVQLRLGKVKDARDTAAAFLDDAALRRSRYRGLALYYHGFANFLL